MHDVEIIYSEERETWNVFVDNEWVYEGTCERCSEIADIYYFDDEEY